jgi:hypothetical protein
MLSARTHHGGLVMGDGHNKFKGKSESRSQKGKFCFPAISVSMRDIILFPGIERIALYIPILSGGSQMDTTAGAGR